LRDKNKYAYALQKHHAKQRGIEWKLTFDEWLQWWGNDLPNRGRGHDKLQMQRYHDAGAYEIGNIKKGYPKENIKTRDVIMQNKKIEKLKNEYQKSLDDYVASNKFAIGDSYEDEEESIADFMKHNGVIKRYR